MVGHQCTLPMCTSAPFAVKNVREQNQQMCGCGPLP